MKSSETNYSKSATFMHACKKHPWRSYTSKFAAEVNNHIRSGELKFYKFLILVQAPACMTSGQRLLLYTSLVTFGRRLDEPQGISK
jgi:hypothetical protein